MLAPRLQPTVAPGGHGIVLEQRVASFPLHLRHNAIEIVRVIPFVVGVGVEFVAGDLRALRRSPLLHFGVRLGGGGGFVGSSHPAMTWVAIGACPSPAEAWNEGIILRGRERV